MATTAQHWITGAHAAVYRATGGKVAGRLMGSPVLLLTRTGRKTGRRRTTPLLYLEDGENMVVVASNGGAPKHPAWWLNLKASPEATVEVRRRKLRVRAEKAGGEERRRLWTQLVEMYPAYEDYQRRMTREIPVVILRPQGDIRQGVTRQARLARSMQELKERSIDGRGRDHNQGRA